MDDLRDDLRIHGERRTTARANAVFESKAIAKIARKALKAGMTKAEICELAQISRPALDTMLKD